MSKKYRVLFILHLFVGIGALFGGLAAITQPDGPMGIPTDTLKNSPFTNFLIPGIILFTVIGLGNILSAFMYRYKLKYQGYISSVFSWALIIWIVVQCIMLRSVVFLHVLFFLIGIVEAAISAVMLFEKRLFPANIAIDIFNSIRKNL